MSKRTFYNMLTAHGALMQVMDLGSANGTFLNKIRLDKMRYVELRHRDMLKFGGSSRDYILLQEDQVKTDKKA